MNTANQADTAIVRDSIERALPRLLALAGRAHGSGDDANAWLRELHALGWVWPPDDELPISRAALVAHVGLAMGQHGLLLDGSALRWVDALHAAAPDGPADLPGADHGGPVHAAWSRADWARFACCALVVGTLHSLVRATVEYVRTRRQFGVPVGSLQAVQHRAVDMYAAAQLADALLLSTAAQPDHSALDALHTHLCSAARCVTQGTIQLHGAIALTAELPIGAAWGAVEQALARHGAGATAAARWQQALWAQGRPA